jgi:hypothetical protein
MRAVIVCVDYADILAVTLPWNRHHFTEVMVVTASHDVETSRVADANDARILTTDAFYDNEAVFNKYLPLEYGLDALGRTGWLCIMDADIMWPKILPDFQFQFGNLYGPRRRMMEDLSKIHDINDNWDVYPLHPQEAELAGYTQIFHADDPHLGTAPWHQTNWKHAGGGDSFFQFKWPERSKIRPPFEVLHLGPAWQNWCGRTTPFVDGSVPEKAKERMAQLHQFIRGRKSGPTRFDHEKF